MPRQFLTILTTCVGVNVTCIKVRFDQLFTLKDDYATALISASCVLCCGAWAEAKRLCSRASTSTPTGAWHSRTSANLQTEGCAHVKQFWLAGRP